MTTAARHPLVEDYLRRLWVEAGRLPVDQARELVADIEEHLSAAIAPDATETEVRNALERLGTPSELVSAASTAPDLPSPAAAKKSFASPGGAIGCLVVAELVIFTGPIALGLWIAGLVMMARATAWTERQKWLGFLVLGSGFVVSILLVFSAVFVTSGCMSWESSDGSSGSTCGGVDRVAVVAWSVVIGYLALQAATTWWLLRRARPSASRR